MRTRCLLPLSAILLTLGLAACGDSRREMFAPAGDGVAPDRAGSVASVESAPAIAVDMAGAGSVGDAPQPEPPVEPPPGEPGEPGVEQAIAYSHALGLRLPVRQVEPLLTAHTAACRSAGPATCIIINSWTNRNSADSMSANLNLKATPAWIDTFLNGMDKSVEAAGGEVTTRSTNAQDLTRQIIDTEARLKALTGLQRRLEALLETRNAGLQDLLGIERELARVNGELDALTTTIRGLRLRVALSDLAISYETREQPVTATTFDPLTGALAGFLRNFTAALGAAITAFANGLPWLLLAGLVLWIWVRLIRPRFGRRRD